MGSLKDVDQNATCDRCLKKTAVLYFHDACTEEALCKACLKAHREPLKQLILRMPDITPCVAPLGYRFVHKHWFALDALGRFQMNEMWKTDMGFTA